MKALFLACHLAVVSLLTSNLLQAATYTFPFNEVWPAQATAWIRSGYPIIIYMDTHGRGYTSVPGVTPVVRTGSGSGLVAHAVLNGDNVATIEIDNPGSYADNTWIEFLLEPPANLIEAAVSNGFDTIVMPGGRFEMTTVLRKDVTIIGQGAEFTQLSAGSNGTVLKVLPGVRVTLRDLTVMDGLAPKGAGIYNDGGVVEATRCKITNNRANGSSSGEGGGIYNVSAGQIFLSDCAVINNQASRNGAGICNSGAGSTMLPGSLTNASEALDGYYAMLGDARRFGVEYDQWDGTLAAPLLISFFHYDYMVLLGDVFKLVNFCYDFISELMQVGDEFSIPDFLNDPVGYLSDWGFQGPDIPQYNYHVITFDEVKAQMKLMRQQTDLAYYSGLHELSQARAPLSICSLSNPCGAAEWQAWAAPTISLSNCIVSGNQIITGASGVGSGIHNELGLLLVNGGKIIDNGITANLLGFGAGIGNVMGAVRITDCTITRNQAVSRSVLAGGGGIYSVAGWIEARNTQIETNRASSTILARGGGIENGMGGMGWVVDCTIAGNEAAQGGGVANDFTGQLSVSRTTLAGNRSISDYSAAGAGIWNECSTAYVSNSTFHANIATGNAQGGGICNRSEAKFPGVNMLTRMSLVNCTFSSNVVNGAAAQIPDPDALAGCLIADTEIFFGLEPPPCNVNTVPRVGMPLVGQGGGIFNGADYPGMVEMTIESCTVFGNSALGYNAAGGGIYNTDTAGPSATTSGANGFSIANSILAQNVGSDFGRSAAGVLDYPRVYGTNMDSDLSLRTSQVGPGTVITGDPRLGPLANNGGPTRTHVLLAGSPALDAAGNTTNYPAIDQRGLPRPSGSRGDLGAFESRAPSATADNFEVVENGCVSIPVATGLMANDSADNATIQVTTGVAHGVLTLSADGSFTYCPAANYCGTDSFTYALVDNQGRSSSATVTLTVSPGLKVLSSEPATNSTAVPRGATFNVSFNQNIDEASARISTRLRGVNSALGGTATVGANGLLSLNPASGAFHDGEQVTLSVLEGLLGQNKSRLDRSLQWQYYTAVRQGDGVLRAGQDLGYADGNAAALGDLNGDGHLDLYVAGGQNDYVYLNDGHGNFALAQTLYGNSTGVALGDIDGNGTLDAVVTKAGGYLDQENYPPEYNRVLFNDGHGYFTVSSQKISNGTYIDERVSPITPLGGGSCAVLLGDLNGDGSLDIFLVNGLSIVGGNRMITPGSAVWLNNGKGYFTRTDQSLAGPEREDWSCDGALGDIDGDGDLDVIVVNKKYQLDYFTTLGGYQVYLNDGHGRFTAGERLAGYCEINGVALGDLNGDGHLDAVTQYRTEDIIYDLPALRVWVGNGQGHFSEGQTWSTWADEKVALGDFNADGKLDIFSCGNYGQLWLNNGSGQFTAGPGFGDKCVGAAIGDVDGDGDVDAAVVLQNWPWTWGNARVQVALNNTHPSTGGNFTYNWSEDAGTMVIPPDSGVLQGSSDPDGDTLTAQIGTTMFYERGNYGHLVFVLGYDWRNITFEGTWPDGTYVYSEVVQLKTTNGLLNLQTNGSFTYTPNPNFHGTDMFTYVVSDGLQTATGHVSIVVASVNDAPAAAADYYGFTLGATLNIDAAHGVLANDSDIDGDMLSAVLEQSTTNGTLTLHADGSFSYQPNAGYYGSDYFTYRASDGSATSPVVQVRLGNVPPVATPDLRYVLPVDGMLTVPAKTGVLTNDFDADHDLIAAKLWSGTTHGTLQLNPDGSFEYVRNPGYAGADEFFYRADDGRAYSQPVRVKVGNTGPLAVDDPDYVTFQDTALTVASAKGVLVNDSDAEGESFTAALVSGPSHGSVEFHFDGSFTYTPAAGYFGSDSFTYHDYDGFDFGSTGTVSIAVLKIFYVVDVQPPLNALNVPANTKVRLTFNRDVEPAELDGRVVISGSLSGVHGWTAEISNRVATLTLSNAFQSGEVVSAVFTDTETPTQRDGYAWQFTVETAQGGTYFTYSNIGTRTNKTAVVGDFNGDSLSDIVVLRYDWDAPTTLYLNNVNRTFTEKVLCNGFAKNLMTGDFDGNGTLDITVDGTLFLNDGHANFTSRSVPVASVTGDFNRDGALDLISIGGSGIQVYLNNGDATFRDGQGISTTKRGDSGAVGDVDGDGDLDLFVLGYGYGQGVDQLWINDGQGTFTLSSQSFGSDPDAAVALGDIDGDGDLDIALSTQMPEEWWDKRGTRIWYNDGHGNFTADVDKLPTGFTVSSAFADINKDGYLDLITAELDATTGSDPYPGTNYIFLNDGTGHFTNLVLNMPFADARSVSVADLDGDGDLDLVFANGQYTTEANAIWWNQRVPRAVDDFYSAGTLTMGATNGVVQNDIAGDMGPIRAFLATQPTNGTVVLETNGAFTFTPRAGFSGQAVFTYYVADSRTSSPPARVKIGNTAPVANPDGGYVALNDVTFVVTAVNGVLTNDFDSDGDRLTALLSSQASHGTVSLWQDGSFTYVAQADYTGADAFSYRVTDGASTSSVVNVSLTVQRQLWVASKSPVPNAVSPGRSNIAVRFNLPLNASSVAANIKLYGSQSGVHTFTSQVFSNLAVLDPARDFYPGEEVTVCLLTGLRGSANEQMKSAVQWKFQVEAPFSYGAFVDSQQPLLNTNFPMTWSVAFADVNGDGKLDAFVGALPKTIKVGSDYVYVVGSDPATVWTNAGGGILRDSGQRLGTNSTYATAFGDLDGDGYLDAVAGRMNYAEVWLNNGSGQFTLRARLGTNLVARDVQLADLDGDGDLDLVSATDNCAIWMNDGAGNFTLRQNLGSTYVWSVRVADLDNDGDLDIVAVGAGCWTWINNGQGVFTRGQNLSSATLFGVGLGDLNGDGSCDIMYMSSTSPSEIWFNNGAGVFTNSGQAIGNNSGTALALADMNGDRFLDAVVIQSNSSGTNRLNLTKVWFNDGTGHLFDRDVRLGQTNVLYTCLAVGDLTGDGTPDVFLGTTLGNTNLVYFNSYGVGPIAGSAAVTIDDTNTTLIFTNAVFEAPAGTQISLGVNLDDPAKGSFTPESLTLAGFSTTNGGMFIRSASSIASAQAAVRLLVFAPAKNRQPVGESETAIFTLMAADNNGVRSNPMFTVTSRSVNDPPLAMPDSGSGFTTTESAAFMTANVLTNDFDPDPGDVLVVQSFNADGVMGQFTNLGNGTFYYKPASNFTALRLGQTATQSFSYTIRDSSGEISTSMVTLTIVGENSAPTAMPDAVTLREHSGPAMLAPLMLANDADPDVGSGTALYIAAVNTNGCRGTVRFLAEDAVSYDPTRAFGNLAAGETATDSFAYVARDEHGATSGWAQVTITITGENDAPIAGADVITLRADCGLTNITALLIANDTDPDHTDAANLRITSLDGSFVAGALWLTNQGVLLDPLTSYQWVLPGETVTNLFMYQIQDAAGATASGSVALLIQGVNDAPQASDDSLTLTRNTGETNLTALMLSNDVDPDTNQTAALVITGIATNGTLGTVILSNGAVLYLPHTPAGFGSGQVLSDSFVYLIEDPLGSSSSAKVQVTIVGQNDAPVPGHDSIIIGNNSGFTNLTPVVLANDYDPNFTDLGGLTISRVLTNGTVGTVVLSNGVLRYSPAGRFTQLPLGAKAEDSFLYLLRDPAGAEVPASVRMTVVGTIQQASFCMSSFSNNTARLSFRGQTGVSYTVLASTNLINWFPLGLATGNSSNEFTFSVTNTSRALFYRLQAEAVSPPLITSFSRSFDKTTHIGFGGRNGQAYTVLTSTNLIDWTEAGPAVELVPGIFDYSMRNDTNDVKRFFRLRSP